MQPTWLSRERQQTGAPFPERAVAALSNSGKISYHVRQFKSRLTSSTKETGMEEDSPIIIIAIIAAVVSAVAAVIVVLGMLGLLGNLGFFGA